MKQAIKQEEMKQQMMPQNKKAAEQNHSSEEIIDIYINYLNTFELSEELKNRILKNITTEKETEKQKTKQFPLRIKLQVAVLAMICIALIFAVFGSRIAQTKTIQHLMNLCGIDTKNDIIRNIIREAEIYAPTLWECSEENLIFATARGAVIYNRREGKIAAVIDLQDIDCHYMNTNTVKTRAYMENNQLWIFNEKKNTAYGNCYVYTIPSYSNTTEIQNLEPEFICEADSEHLQKWQEYYSGHYRSTYEAMKNSTFNDEEKNDKQCSKEVFLWTTTKQKNVQSFLVTNPQNGECFLYTCGTDDIEFNEEDMELLNVSLTEEAFEELKLSDRLPEYVYTGESAIFAAICEYLYSEENQSAIKFTMEYYNRSLVWIPAPVIFDIVEEDGEIKVFGNFYSFTYYKSGNTLECESGGEYPACIHMKETKEGYEVISMEKAGDGKRYTEDIKDFCQGHPFIQLKYWNHEKVRQQAEEMRKQLIKGYVASQGLNIEYYHDSGQDPVAIWEE